MGFFECCHFCKEKRFPGCHSTCPDYADAKKDWDARREAVRKAKDVESIMSPAQLKAMRNRQRRNRQRR